MSDGYPDDWDQRRKRVYRRDGYKCQRCGAGGGPSGNTELHAHHKTPKGKGGSHNLSNLQTLCKDCHSRAHGHPVGGNTSSSNGYSSGEPASFSPVWWFMTYVILGGYFLAGIPAHMTWAICFLTVGILTYGGDSLKNSAFYTVYAFLLCVFIPTTLHLSGVHELPTISGMYNVDAVTLLPTIILISTNIADYVISERFETHKYIATRLTPDHLRTSTVETSFFPDPPASQGASQGFSGTGGPNYEINQSDDSE